MRIASTFALLIRPSTLPGWLEYLEKLHPKSIAMGLDRVRLVHARLDANPVCPVITVTGTNGKGSTCAMLASMLRSAGYRVGAYTSPHLVRYHERVVIDGVALEDRALVTAFAAVEDARTALEPAVPLTYFEFGTLAALWAFAHARLDVLVLEIGLGGRLDAVNIIDPDVAVVTSVDLDHMDYLGPTREDIGREKAGIMRAGRPAICGDPHPPASLVAHAMAIGARLVRIGREYGFTAQGTHWSYWGPGGPRHGLPQPSLRGHYQLGNAATAIAALAELRQRLPVSGGAVREGLVSVELPGRFGVLPGRPVTVLDVAHNPHAARALAETLGAMGFYPVTYAVFGMLADKDIDGVIAAVMARIDHWLVATLPSPRGASSNLLFERLVASGVRSEAITRFDDIVGAWRQAKIRAGQADRILVFGSFLTVGAVLAAERSSDAPGDPR